MPTNSQAVVTASFVRLQTMADGTPRLILDCDCSLADISQLNLTPGAPLAIARLTEQSAGDHQQKEFLKGGPLSREAAGLCKNIDFQRFVEDKVTWVGSDKENIAACYIRWRCCVDSRAELDHHRGPANEFQHIKREFLEWNTAKM